MITVTGELCKMIPLWMTLIFILVQSCTKKLKFCAFFLFVLFLFLQNFKIIWLKLKHAVATHLLVEDYTYCIPLIITLLVACLASQQHASVSQGQILIIIHSRECYLI